MRKFSHLLLGIALMFIAFGAIFYSNHLFAGMMNGSMMNGSYGEQYRNTKPSENLTANTKRGEQLFESLCASCHGKNAQGGIGPNIVGSSVHRITWALNNVNMMRNLKTNNKSLNDPQSIADISAFLTSL